MKLHEAIKSNNADEVRKALKRIRKIDRGSSDMGGYAPLMYAAQLDADQAISVLREAGALTKSKHSLERYRAQLIEAMFELCVNS